MAIVTLGHNITRHEDFEGSPPGTLSSIGSGPGAGFRSGLNYEGVQCIQRRIGTTGSDHGFTWTSGTTLSLLAAGQTVWYAKSYTVLTPGGLTEQKLRCGSATTAYHEYLIADDGTEGDNQDFLSFGPGGYVILPVEVARTAWINRGITGSPNVTVNDVYGTTFNVTVTTGAGDSAAFDAVDLTDDGLFLWGGDGASADGKFTDFTDADLGSGLTGAERVGMWRILDGIFFVFGYHVIGRTDAGTVTNTAFTDADKTLVFPGGFVGPGFNGLEFDLGNASTLIDLDGISVSGRGRTDLKRYFDTELDVTGGATDQIAITAHGFSTGDQVAYSAEGGTEDIGPDATTGESDLVGSGGPGTGDNWYVAVIDADNIQLHATASDAFTGTTPQGLTASTAGNGENHSLRRQPDTRPDVVFTGTSASVSLSDWVIQSARNLTLTSSVTLNDWAIKQSQSLTLAGGALNGGTVSAATLPVGEAFVTTTTSADLANIDNIAFTSGGFGHAIEVTTTATTVGFDGNTFTGYGPGSADSTGAHDHEFDSTTDVNATTDAITLAVDNFVTGDAIYYSDEGGAANIGLTDGNLYYVRRDSASVYGIFPTEAAANANSNRIALTSTGAETHVLYSANAAFHNSTGGTITLNIGSGGGTPSVRNSAGSTTIINNAVTLTVTVKDQAGNAVENAQVAIYDNVGTELMNELTTAAGVASESFAYATDTAIEIKVRKSSFGTRFVPNDSTGTITATGFSSTVTLRTDIITSPAILNATSFDGSTDYFTRGANLTGIADGKEGTISLWIDPDSITSDDVVIGTTNNRFACALLGTGSNQFEIVGLDTGGTIRLDLESTTAINPASGWFHILASWDLTNTANVFLFLNDVDDTNSVTHDNINIDYTDTDFAVGATPGGLGNFDGCVSEIWFHPTYIDLSVEANRRKFVLRSDQDNRVEPAFLGDSGQRPLGFSPILYLPNSFSSFGTNAGTGGDLTEDAGSSVVACATTPIPI